MARLFVSQDRIDRWASEGKVSLDGDVMSLPKLGRRFRLAAAVYVTRVVSDNADAHALVGRVKTETQLRAMGAETYITSILLGDTAYECEPGFVGEVLGGIDLPAQGVSHLNH